MSFLSEYMYKPDVPRRCGHRSMRGEHCNNKAIVSTVMNPQSRIDPQAQDLCSQCLEVVINRLRPEDQMMIMRL